MVLIASIKVRFCNDDSCRKTTLSPSSKAEPKLPPTDSNRDSPSSENEEKKTNCETNSNKF
jgi:hypothetical protein